MTNTRLSDLPAPDIIEPLDHQAILDDKIARFKKMNPDYTGLLPSDPVFKALELSAYDELVLRQRINDAARAVMPAYARGTDADHLASRYHVYRETLHPGDPDARPPVPATMESDNSLIQRALLAFEGFSTAGPKGSYQFYALSASAVVKAVEVQSPAPCEVLLTVLSHQDDGSASEPLLETVLSAVNDDDVRPLTDKVTVQSAGIRRYSIDAELKLEKGVTEDIALQAAQEAIRKYSLTTHRLGAVVSLSAIYAALHQTGVLSVVLHHPRREIVCQSTEAPFCTSIKVTGATR